MLKLKGKVGPNHLDKRENLSEMNAHNLTDTHVKHNDEESTLRTTTSLLQPIGCHVQAEQYKGDEEKRGRIKK